MNTMIDPHSSTELESALRAMRGAASALEPPPELEARLRRTLFGAAAVPAVAAVVGARRVATSTPAPHLLAPAMPRVHATHAANATRTAATARSPAGFIERWAAWLVWPAAVAATIILCSWMLVAQPALDPTVDAGSTSAASQMPASTEPTDIGTPFLALAPLDEITASGRSEVVAATVPRATLAEFGLPVSPMHAADDIDAEFLVGPSGGVLAVRFVVADVR